MSIVSNLISLFYTLMTLVAIIGSGIILALLIEKLFDLRS
jgi:hypothetical protein